jgi:hypothetical protein
LRDVNAVAELNNDIDPEQAKAFVTELCNQLPLLPEQVGVNVGLILRKWYKRQYRRGYTAGYRAAKQEK